ncbi:MAG: O-antigen ligase family protein [Thermoleophilia bacterium]
MATSNSNALLTLSSGALRLGWMEKGALVILIVVMAVASVYPIQPGNLFFGSWPMSLLTLLVPLLALAEFAFFIKKRGLLYPNRTDLAILTFSLFFILRNITVPGGVVTLKYTLLGPGLFLLTSLLARKKQSRDTLVYAIVALAAITAIYGILEYANQKNILFPDVLVESSVQIHRIGSLPGHPVIYGGLLVQVIPFCFLMIFQSKRLPAVIFGISATIWATAALLLTYSKGSWLAMSVVVIGLIIFLMKKQLGRGLVLVGMGCLAIIILAIVFSQQIVAETVWRLPISAFRRADSWQWTLNAIHNNFFFGTGVRQGTMALINHGAGAWFEMAGYPPPIDNFYLTLWLETGLCGFVLFMTSLVLILKETIGYLISDQHNVHFMLAALASLAGMLLNAFTFEALFDWPNLVMFWLVAGMVHGLIKAREADYAHIS